MNWLRTTSPLPKFQREWLFARRYSCDQALATGQHAFAGIQPGGDPPDVTAQTGAGRIGVESTALAIQGRREAHGLFMELRRRLQGGEPAAFGQLAGHLVYVWFEDPGVPGITLPHKRSDETALEALVAALAEYEPQTQQLWVPSGPLPEQAPDLPLADTSTGARFYAVPLISAAPSSMLFSIAGFELGLAFTTFLTAEEAWREIERLVSEHDQPGVDLLLMTAGGPDANGNVFPVEEAVMDFVAMHAGRFGSPPNHVTSVVMHSWATGRAVQIFPEARPLFGPLYHSLVPLHHSLAPTDQTGVSSASLENDDPSDP